jgi:hypothetical protein
MVWEARSPVNKLPWDKKRRRCAEASMFRLKKLEKTLQHWNIERPLAKPSTVPEVPREILT